MAAAKAIAACALAGFLALSATPALAAPEKSYVVCDNGLRCFAPPCPSTNALDVRSGRLSKGVWPDTSRLNRKDQAELQRSDALYRGTQVVRGRIVRRTRTFLGKPRRLPFLVVSGVERPSTAREQRLCRGR